MRTKMLIATAAFATALASPALAQTATPRNQVQAVPAPFEQSGPIGRAHSLRRSYDVYQNGQYVGSDPDPNIRLQLQREYESNEW